MTVAKISKIRIKQARGPIFHPINQDEFFEKKAAKARLFLEEHPVPEELFKKKI